MIGLYVVDDIAMPIEDQAITGWIEMKAILKQSYNEEKKKWKYTRWFYELATHAGSI